jgi:Skp family chaperone for outer membrane proteins
MRKLLFFVFATIVCSSYQTNAQTFKFGHVNSTEIWSQMPDLDSVRVQLERVEKDLRAIITEMSNELQKSTLNFKKIRTNGLKWLKNPNRPN